MATISFTINKGGSPLEGAKIIFGDVVGTPLITNSSGTVSATVPESFAVYVPTTIKHNSLTDGRRDIGCFLYEAGEVYVLNI